jgi:hypothetical protein
MAWQLIAVDPTTTFVGLAAFARGQELPPLQRRNEYPGAGVAVIVKIVWLAT